jgi:hypothetical protein
MTKARRKGLSFLILGSLVFILLGGLLENSSKSAMQDFGVVYYPARCLIQHCDPYNESEVLRVNRAEQGYCPLDTLDTLGTTYLPSVFSVVVPFALLPWGPAHLLWMTLTVGSLILASFLIWRTEAHCAPMLSGVLIGFLLANSEVTVILCNPAGIAVALCVVAVLCFIEERFAAVGILCLAASLAIKPHNAGLVWLYFLLAGGVYRKRALQTLLATFALILPAVLWVWQASPNWIQEWRANIVAYSALGGINDPGPGASLAHGGGRVIDLQTVISVFRDDPRIYNPVSYLICAPLLLIWAWVTLRSRPSLARTWLALASIAALSLLPVYHHFYDAKILLLAVPACAMLWAEGGLIGWLALLVTTAGFVLTGDATVAILFRMINNLHLPTTGLSGQIVAAAQIFPAPLALLVMGAFYLWVYVKRCSATYVPTPDSTNRD